MTATALSVPATAWRMLRTWPHLIMTGLGLALMLVLLAFTLAVREPNFQHFLLRTDFPAFLTGARLVATGQGAALYDPAAQAPVQAAILAPYSYPRGILPYNHLPFLALVLAPVSALPVPVAYGLWLAATVLALVTALVLLSREMLEVVRTPEERRWGPPALWALGFGFFPVYQCLLQVQTAPWDLLGYTLMVRYLRQGREVAAGLALALVLVKPQLLIVPVLVLLYGRRWRVLGAFAALAGGLSLLVTPLLGGFGWVGRYLALLGNVATVNSGNSTIQPPLMENWRGFFTLLAARYDAGTQGTGAATWVLVLTVLASIAILAVLAVAWGRPGAFDPGRDRAGWDARWAATILAALLVSPHGFGYELVLWLLPAVLAWRAAHAGASAPTVGRTARLLATGYVAGSIALPLLTWSAWPLHLGALFMAVAIPVLAVSGGRAARFHIP